MIDNKILEKLYESEPLEDKGFLMSAMVNYETIFVGISAWYLHVRKRISNEKIFFMLNEKQLSIIISNLVLYDYYDIRYIILVINFLCTDSWWKRLPSAFSLDKIRKKDYDGISLFEKIALAYERSISRKIDEYEKAEKDSERAMRRFL